ncbi:MAG TPA: hypothetical protein VF800_08925 [Telluria sp.]|jgi:hypothetical protein
MNPPFLYSLKCLVLPLFILAMAGNAHAHDVNDDIYGRWKIKAMIGGGISSLSDRQARAFIGKSVVISKEKFLFNGKTCLHPPYARSVEPVDAYFEREWRARVTDIALPDPVTIIDAECNMLYPMRKNHLMIAEDGVFFEAVRVKR